MKTGLGLLLISGALLLSACAPLAPYPREPEPPAAKPPPSRPTVPEPPAIKRPVERPAPAQAAVAGLLQQAWGHYRSNNFDGAIAVAERAQRLDPRDAEAYLVLASSYFAQAQYDQTARLAQRGIAYSAPGTIVRGRLEQLLRQVNAAR
ncbi:MAG: tetratricopeptide repeat protein [Porticoccaceae bacterium]